MYLKPNRIDRKIKDKVFGRIYDRYIVRNKSRMEVQQ